MYTTQTVYQIKIYTDLNCTPRHPPSPQPSLFLLLPKIVKRRQSNNNQNQIQMNKQNKYRLHHTQQNPDEQTEQVQATSYTTKPNPDEQTE